MNTFKIENRVIWSARLYGQSSTLKGMRNSNIFFFLSANMTVRNYQAKIYMKAVIQRSKENIKTAFPLKTFATFWRTFPLVLKASKGTGYKNQSSDRPTRGV